MSRLAWNELSVESQSTYELPSGRDPRIKLAKATFILSGRRERTTSIFWKGTLSKPALGVFAYVRGFAERQITECTVTVIYPNVKPSVFEGC